MIKIELLIPLAYFGIAYTLSTETAKIAHPVVGNAQLMSHSL